jgi:HSP20 family protein
MSQTRSERRRPSSALERWQPFSTDVQELNERMRRLLDETFGGYGRSLFVGESWSPPVDIEEQDDAYVVEAEVPGVKRQDVDVELIGNDLTISGELKEQERKGIVRKQTRRTGRFEYHVRLPEQVSAGGVDAKLDDGVLSVRLPKAEKAQRKQIEIKVK